MHSRTDQSERQRQSKGTRGGGQHLTPAGREKLRQTALKHQPWRCSTGPRTAAGKAKVALNGKRRQVGELSVREMRRELSGMDKVLADLAAIRQALSRPLESQITPKS